MTDFYCVKCNSDREQDCHCYDDDYVPPPSPRKVLSDQAIHDLWGIGFTIVPRVDSAKVYDLAAGAAPSGMAYQWNADRETKGWKNVPASRHPGLFTPYCVSGDIEVGGLWLMERPKAEVDAFHAASHAKARKNVDDWYARTGSAGFTGGVTVLTEGSSGREAEVAQIGGGESSRTKIPMDLFDHLPALLAERDKILEEKIKICAPLPISNLLLGSFRKTAMRIAIYNVRYAIKKAAKKAAKERAQHDQSTDGRTGDAEPSAGNEAQAGAAEGRQGAG